MSCLSLVKTSTELDKQRNSPWEAMHVKWGQWGIGLTMGEENLGIKQRQSLALCETYYEMFRERTEDMEKEGSRWTWEG